MTSKEKALSLFNSGFNCAQSIFAAYSEKVGLDETQAKMVSTGFGAGIARTQGLCGAISGAVMLLGCKYTNVEMPIESKELIYQKVLEVIEDFKKTHGSSDCIDLIGVNVSTPEGQAIAKELKVHENLCTNYLSYICDMLDKELNDKT